MTTIEPEKLGLISGLSDQKCGLFEFTNESDAVEVGFLCWLPRNLQNDSKNLQEIINDKVEIQVYWPSNCDISFTSKMAKRLKKTQVEWEKVSAKVLAQGSM